jgi:hypothetical protein
MMYGILIGLAVGVAIHLYVFHSYQRMLLAKSKSANNIECLHGEFVAIVPEREYANMIRDSYVADRSPEGSWRIQDRKLSDANVDDEIRS